MALTLAVEQELAAAGLVDLFGEHQPAWTAAAAQTKGLSPVIFLLDH